MNGTAVVAFRICTPGSSFHDPANTSGRLIPVCQSTCVSNVRPYNTCRTPPGAVASGMSNSRRAVDVWSTIVRLLDQFQRPMRSGVPTATSVARVSKDVASVSSGPTSNGLPLMCNDCVLLNENEGDHVIASPTFTAAGVSVTVGNVCVTSPLPNSWCREPPTLSVPQSNVLL